MDVKVERQEHNMAMLTVTVDKETFEKATVTAYNKNKSKFSVPGFRKGKTPKAMIEKIYGAGVFYEEAVDIVLNETYPEAAKESELEIVSRPEIDIVSLSGGKDFVYSAKVAVKPPVTLGQYKGVSVEKAEVVVSAAEVSEKLNQVREQNARIVESGEEGRKVRKDDIVTIDFEGFTDGKAFEGGKGTDYPLTIGSHSFIDGFEDQLIGSKKGDGLDVNVTFPENYQAKELAGKPALFKVTVKEIKEKLLPELDDEFASEVSEFETLKEYKASLKKEIEAEKAKAAAQQNENNVVKAVVAEAEADIPEAMIDSVAENMLNEYAERLKNQGIPFDQYMKITGQTAESLREQMKPNAKENIKTNLVLEKIAEEENLTVSDERLDEEIAKIAAAYKMEAGAVKEMMGEEKLREMRTDLKCQAAIDLIVAEARLTAKKKAAKAEKAVKEEKAAREEKSAENRKPAKKAASKKEKKED